MNRQENQYQVFARRYRPKRFSEVLGQEATVTTLKNAIRLSKAAHAYLFSGSRGVGKTTLARIFAKALNCQNRQEECEPCNECPSCKEIHAGQSLDVIEIDGASNRGIDDIRQINETAYYAPSSGGFKIYIIDEVHMLTKEAFNALLKTLEEPPLKAKFFFATTESHKVLPTILSRCQRFDLKRISTKEIVEKLQKIAEEEKREVSSEALHSIANFAEGALRDAESLFDQLLCFKEDRIEEDDVRSMLGLVPQTVFFDLDQAFSKGNIRFAFELVESLFSEGKNLPHFLSQLIEHIRKISLFHHIDPSLIPLSLEQKKNYQKQAPLYPVSQALYLLDYLLRQEIELTKAFSERVFLENLLVHYLQTSQRIPTETLIKKLSELEKFFQTKEEVNTSFLIEEKKLFKEEPIDSLPSSEEKTKTAEKELIPITDEKRTFQETPEKKEIEPSATLKDEKKIATSESTTQSLPTQEKNSSPHQEPSSLIEPEKKSIDASKRTKKKELAPSDFSSNEKKEDALLSPKNMLRYETLMRFAAVELEGTVSIKL